LIVLASHLLGHGHAAFNITRHRVVPIECRDDFDYWEGVNEWWWSDETIVLLEHDVECDDSHLDELHACEHTACFWLYRGHWQTTHVPDGILAATRNGLPVGDGDEWADWTAIGLLKLTPEARTGRLRREPWNALEFAVNDASTGPIHLHGQNGHEVTHHHF
jgi:hypothetical protein